MIDEKLILGNHTIETDKAVVEKKRFRDTKYIIYSNGDIQNGKTGLFLKTQDNGTGYEKVTLTHKGIQHQFYVHRLVAECFVEKCKDEIDRVQVNHKNGNKRCNHFWNLEWVNNSENQKHAHRTGLKKNGNQLWNGKFSKDNIMRIKRLKKSGMLQYRIAEIMNVSKSTISDIVNDKRYKYI